MLNGQQEAFALAVASGSMIKTAAASVGAAESTGWMWSANPEVRERISELRGRLINEQIGRLTDMATRAFKKMEHLMENALREETQLRAVQGIIDSLLKIQAHQDEQTLKSLVLPRLQALEDAKEASNGDA